MRRFVPLILAVLLLAVAIPALAVSEFAPEDLDHNRRLLERYRADPEHYARLLRDLRAFQALPTDRQERMRQFDRDLHEEDPDAQSRLWEVLERYSDWASRLQESDKRRIDATGDPAERLAVIKDLRQKEWIDRLPKTDRDAVLALPEPARSARLTALRKEERQRRLDWRDWANGQKPRPDLGPRPNRPARLAEFPPDVRTYVADQLTPMLTDEEKERWKRAAQGRWPRLADAILELSEKHPVLPPLPAGSIVKYDQLPMEVKKALPQDRLQKQNQWGELQKKEGKWPQYALAVVDLMKQETRTPPLGASRPAEFSADAREAINKLKDADQAKLRELEGRWPDYPLALLEIGRKNNLLIPGMSLPGPRELWDNVRTALPDVPDRVLFAFGQSELSPEAKANLMQAGDDQAERREILKQEYFKKNPRELQRLRRLDRRGPNFDKQ
jgi:outer membrane protein OmpA-like peptidoglycan-associated protein